MSNRKYIILNEDKQPLHKFKDETDRKTWDEVEGCDNIGMVVEAPFVVLDFDTKQDADIMLNLVQKAKIQCNVMRTDRGYHFWFRSGEKCKNFVKSRLAIGLWCDRKVCYATSYVVIKRRGIEREWLQEYPEDEMDYLPKWLTPVPASKYDFVGMGEGDGRNETLFKYILVLQNAGFKRADIVQTLTVINKYVFAQPMKDSEMKNIFREEAFKDEEEIQEQKQEREASAPSTKFDHTIYVDMLKEQNKIITLHDVLYIYRDGYYQMVDKEIEKQLINLCPSIKQSQRNEVISYLKIDTSIDANEVLLNPYMVNMANGRFDMKLGILNSYDEKLYEFSRIPVTYDPFVKCDTIDNMLKKVFLDNKEVIDLFEEILACCLVRKSIWQKAFIFYGSGSNGKSVLFDMIRNFLGDANVSSIELDKLGKSFTTAELEHKLCNIGDDLNFVHIKDNGTVKKLITGDAVQVERKYGNPFSFKSYATQIFATNDLPHSADKSDGMMRRLCFIPCLAKFKDTDKDYDPNIIDKITTEEAKTHLFNLALRGFQRLERNKKFTEPKVVKRAKERYKVDNSTVLTWVMDENLDREFILSKPTIDLYLDFKAWCGLNGVKDVVGKKCFNKELVNHFGLSADTIVRKLDGRAARYFKINLDD